VHTSTSNNSDIDTALGANAWQRTDDTSAQSPDYLRGYEAGVAAGREAAFEKGFSAGFLAGQRAAVTETTPTTEGSTSDLWFRRNATGARRLLGLPCTQCGAWFYSDEAQCPRCKAPKVTPPIQSG
jgi:hypothetical protein